MAFGVAATTHLIYIDVNMGHRQRIRRSECPKLEYLGPHRSPPIIHCSLAVMAGIVSIRRNGLIDCPTK